MIAVSKYSIGPSLRGESRLPDDVHLKKKLHHSTSKKDEIDVNLPACDSGTSIDSLVDI